MTDPTTRDRATGDLLAQVHEGMEVYDSAEKRVGKVDSVYMGARADAPAAGGEPALGAGPETTRQDSLIENMAEAFSPDLPPVLSNRLRHNGFVRVRGGLLKGDRFALREHVAAVTGDRVLLNIRAEEMVGA
jgi:hypothetical protein